MEKIERGTKAALAATGGGGRAGGDGLSAGDKWTANWGRFFAELQQMSREFRTHEQIVADTLSRYSVQDLTEQTDAALERGDELFYNATDEITVMEKGTTDLIDWWKVRSGDDREYECRRFKNFAWCSCRAFHFSRKMCKHLAVTVGVYCQHCREFRAKHGKLCHACNVTQNQFLKRSLNTSTALAMMFVFSLPFWLGNYPQFKVFKSVVIPNAVFVMDVLGGAERTFEMPSHNYSMFEDGSTFAKHRSQRVVGQQPKEDVPRFVHGSATFPLMVAFSSLSSCQIRFFCNPSDWLQSIPVAPNADRTAITFFEQGIQKPSLNRAIHTLGPDHFRSAFKAEFITSGNFV